MNYNKMNVIKNILLGFFCCLILSSCKKDPEISKTDKSLSFRFNNAKLDEDIQRIFYGVTVESGIVKIKDLPLLISFKNNTGQEVNPLVVYVNLRSKVPLKFSRYYKLWKERIVGDSVYQRHEYDLFLDDRLLMPFEKIPFPITEIVIGEASENILFKLVYGSDLQSLKQMQGGLFIYPLVRGNKNYEASFFEHVFLGDIWNFINWNNPQQTALAFDSVLVPRLTNYKLYEPKDFKVRQLKELLSD